VASTVDSALGAGPVEQAAERVEDFAEAAAECCSEWSEQLRGFTKIAEEYIRKQPIQSLLIAGGVGLLVGLAMRRGS
jgi:ElaB/YqjD/DUF883 family membrane-anchored ribosome-binding protein